MFHLEAINNPVFLLRGNASKDEFIFGDKYDFVLIVEILSQSSCFVKGANGTLPRHCVKEFLKTLGAMGFTRIDWEHKGKPQRVEIIK